MIELNTITLKNIDSEDVSDILIKLEKSFGIKYNDNAFKEVKTFGNICDVIEAQINLEHKDDCTSQQAFYKIRKAISQTHQIEETEIHLESDLEYFFPRQDRRQKIKKFQQHLGIKLDLLRMKEWLVRILFSGFILSLVAFFFNWKIAVSGLSFFYIVSRIAIQFSKELVITTVRQLTEKLARDNYLAARRSKGTGNKKEFFKIIQDTFSTDLDLDKSLLTRDASFGWK